MNTVLKAYAKNPGTGVLRLVTSSTFQAADMQDFYVRAVDCGASEKAKGNDIHVVSFDDSTGFPICHVLKDGSGIVFGPHSGTPSSLTPVGVDSRVHSQLIRGSNPLEDKILSELECDTDLAAAMLPIILVNLKTLDRKQQDYGPVNLIKFGPFGVVVRMNDKMERIINLLKKRENQRSWTDSERAKSVELNESVSDSFLDLANYALIAYVMEKKLWPVDKK